MKEPIIAGVDAGSASIKTVIARVTDNTLDVIGIGETPSDGIRKGIIVNIDAATEAINHAINIAESMAGLHCPDIIAAIGGEHIQGINSKGVIGVNTKTKEVTSVEIERVCDSAKNILLPSDREIIEAIEQEYSLDGQDEIKNPVGMTGTRLEAEIHIITGLKYVSENLKKTLQRMDFSAKDIIPAIRGSAEASLTEDEKQLGVALLDIGHSTTSLIVFIEGAVWHTAVIPIGGQHITNDIAAGLRITAPMAETVKRDYGYAFIDMVSRKEIIEIPKASGNIQAIQKRVLTEIIQPRVEEILGLVGKELAKINCIDLLAGGMVFTGGGANLPGLTELVEAYKESVEGASLVNARIGVPDKISGIRDIAQNPAYSAVIGILQMSIAETLNNPEVSQKKKNEKIDKPRFFKKNLFKEFFN